MYSEWASLTSLIQNGNEESQSVLGKFPIPAGKEVAVAVVKQLAANLGFAQAAEPSPLTTDREVQWCMEASRKCVVFIPKSGEVAGGQKKLHDYYEIHNLCILFSVYY
jgi:hypothetical protein